MSDTNLKTCTSCGETKSRADFYRRSDRKDGVNSYCKDCHNARMKARVAADPEKKKARYRAWSRANPEKVQARRLNAKMQPDYRESQARRLRDHRERHPMRERARHRLNDAVADGRIKRPERCSRCGALAAIEAHHHDYSKPLEVMWVCKGCHTAIHMELRHAALPTQ